MKIYKKFRLNIMTVCIFSCMLTINVFANTEQNISQNIAVLNIQDNTAVPYAEKTGYKYKYINGVKYKRLWSYTYNRWIDDGWYKA